jgi:hypothetical protein
MTLEMNAVNKSQPVCLQFHYILLEFKNIHAGV